MSTGRVIVLEGIDGAGTSTLAQALSHWLETAGYTVFRTQQPSRHPTGQQIRKLLREPTSNETRRAALALSFAADRLLLWEEIREAVAQDKWVICDRSKLSSLVYQGSELPEDWVRSINRYAPDADLTLLLDLPATTAMARIEARGAVRERFETLSILDELTRRYQRLAREDFGSPVVLLNADVSAEKVLLQAKQAIEALR